MNKKILNKILHTLKKKPNNIFNINVSVKNYDYVLNEWKIYKKSKTHENITIKNIFDIHLQSNNHIILYSSKELDDVLCMCKMNNIYKYIQLPYLNMNNKMKKMKSINFVAFYS
tara:strand:+ start:1142 stop:1483 length:342 start_codon:yes stop_codon:yes gene_type:complete